MTDGTTATKAHKRIGAAIVLVCVLALSAEGDVVGGQNITDNGESQKRAAERGFTYSAWVRNRRVYSESGFVANAESGDAGVIKIEGVGDSGDNNNYDNNNINNNNINNNNNALIEKAGSFWGDVAIRLGDNAIERARGSLLGIFPKGSEMRDILLRYGNGEDFDMAQWREIRKRRLQEDIRTAPVAFYADAESALADAISETAEERLSFVRRARINLQTSLGGRSGNLAINAVGALRERDDDIIGWQLRAFGSDDGKGGNAGLYYRRILGDVWGDTLAGINAFADYENDKQDGGFLRWSLGGEVKSRFGELSVNRYFVLTDARTLADGGYAYSRAGHDIEFAVRVPKAEWVRTHLAYYNFRGEFGDSDDKGFRFGVDLEPGNGLIIGLEYDNESSDLGGNVAYAHNFGEVLPSAANAGTFDPRAHFFDEVRREYTQRITRVDNRGNPLSFNLTTSQLPVFVDAPTVEAVIGGGDIAAADALVGFTATVSPGPPFAVSGNSGNGLISLAGLDRYALTLNRELTLATDSGADNAAGFRQLFDAWVLTLHGDTRVMLNDSGVLSVINGGGVFERFRPEVISVVISDEATIRLAGTRIAFTTIADDNDNNNSLIVFNLQEGTATIEAMPNGSVNVQSAQGRAVAVLPVADGGFSVVSSCGDIPQGGANIRFACEAANAPPVVIIGGGDSGGRAIIPAELNAATLIATLINLGDAYTNFSFSIITGGDVLAISQPDTNGVIEASVIANPSSGDTELVVGITDRGGDASSEVRRTVRVRVLQPLALSTTPSGVATITTQQDAGARVFVLRGSGGDGSYTYSFVESAADFTIRQGAVVNDTSITDTARRRLTIQVEDNLQTQATITAIVEVVDPPALALDISDIAGIVASANIFVPAGNAVINGGLQPRLSVRYDVDGVGDISIRINADSGLLEVRGRELRQLTITIIGGDRHTRIAEVMATRIISISPGLVLPLPLALAGGAEVTTFGGFESSRTDLATFRGETRFTIVGYRLLNNHNGILALTPSGDNREARLSYIANNNSRNARRVMVSVEVLDNSPQGIVSSTPNRATAIFALNIVNPPPVAVVNAAAQQNPGSSVGIRRNILLATASGGFVRNLNDYTFSILPSNNGGELANGTSGSSRNFYYTPQTARTITISIIADDRHNNTPAATLPVVLTAIPLPIGFDTSGLLTIVATADTQNRIGIIRATGGLSPYSYVIAGAGAGGRFTFGMLSRADGGANILVGAPDIGLATMTIRASDSHEFSDDGMIVITITSSPGLVMPLPAGYNNLRLTTQDPRALDVRYEDFVASGGTNISYRLEVHPQIAQLIRIETRMVNNRSVGRLIVSPGITSPLVPAGIVRISVIATGTNLRGVADAVTVFYDVEMVNPPALRLALTDRNPNVRPQAGRVSVALIRQSGDIPPHNIVRIIGGNRGSFDVANDGADARLFITNPNLATPRHLITLEVSNRHTALSPARFVVSVTVVDELDIQGADAYVIHYRPVIGGGESLLTIAAIGGMPPYAYEASYVLNAPQAGEANNLTIGGNSGVIRLVEDNFTDNGANRQGIPRKTDNEEYEVIVSDSAVPVAVSATATVTIRYGPPQTPIRVAEVLTSVNVFVRGDTDDVLRVAITGGYIGGRFPNAVGVSGYDTQTRAAVGGIVNGILSDSANTDRANNILGFSYEPRPARNSITLDIKIRDDWDENNTERYLEISMTLRVYDALRSSFGYPAEHNGDLTITPAGGSRYHLGTISVSGGSGSYNRFVSIEGNTPADGAFSFVADDIFYDSNSGGNVPFTTNVTVVSDDINLPQTPPITHIFSMTLLNPIALAASPPTITATAGANNHNASAPIASELVISGGQAPYTFRPRAGDNSPFPSGLFADNIIAFDANNAITGTLLWNNATFNSAKGKGDTETYAITVSDSSDPPRSVIFNITITFANTPLQFQNILPAFNGVIAGVEGRPRRLIVSSGGSGSGYSLTVFSANYRSGNQSDQLDVSVSDNNTDSAHLVVNASRPGAIDVRIIGMDDRDNRATLTISVTSFAQLGFDSGVIGNAFRTVVATSDVEFPVGIVPATGGIGTYIYQVFGGNDDIVVNINGGNGEVRIQSDVIAGFTITLSVSDAHPDSVDAGITITMSAAAGVVLGLPSEFAAGVSVTIRDLTDQEFNIGRLAPEGGENYVYSFDGNGDNYTRIADNGDIFYIARSPAADNATTVSISVIVAGNNPNRNNAMERATASFVMHIQNPPPVIPSIDGEINRRFFLHNTAPVNILTVRAAGGISPNATNPYTFEATRIHTGLVINRTNGVVSYSNPLTASVTIVVRGLHRYNFTNPAALTVTLEPVLSMTAFYDTPNIEMTLGATVLNFIRFDLRANNGAVVDCRAIQAVQGIVNSYAGGNNNCHSTFPANAVPGGELPSVGMIIAEARHNQPINQTATATITINFVSPAPLSYDYDSALNNDNRIYADGNSYDIATITVKGGHFNTNADNFAISTGAANQGILELTPAGNNGRGHIFVHKISAEANGVISITIFAADQNDLTPDITIIRTITAVTPLDLVWTPRAITLTTGLDNGRVAVVNVIGGTNPGIIREVAGIQGRLSYAVHARTGGEDFIRANLLNVNRQEEGIEVVRVQDDFLNGSIWATATISIFVRHGADTELEVVGNINNLPPAPQTPTRISIATLTARGDFPPFAIGIFGTHPSLAIVDSSVLVLNNARADNPAHTVTVQATDTYPNNQNGRLIISVTVQRGLFARGTSVDVIHDRDILADEDIFSVVVLGGTPPYTYDDVPDYPTPFEFESNSGRLYLEGPNPLFAGIQPELLRRSVPLTNAIIITDSSSPPLKLTVSVTINFIDEPIVIGTRDYLAQGQGALVNTDLPVYHINNISGGSGEGFTLSLVSAGFINTPDQNPPDNNAINVMFRTDAADTFASEITVNSSQTGTVRAVLQLADDADNGVSLSVTAAFFAPLAVSGLRVVDFINGNPIGYPPHYPIIAQVNEEVGGLSYRYQFSGGNNPDSEDRINHRTANAPDNGTFSNNMKGNATEREAFVANFGSGASSPTSPQTIIYQFVINDLPFGDTESSQFNQSVTILITQIAINHTINASLDRRPGALNPSGLSTLGSILVSGGLTSAASNYGAQVATIGVTNNILTASIAADGGVFLNANTGGAFSITLIVRDSYLDNEVHTASLTITGNIPFLGLNLGFSESPNTTFITNSQVTIGNITATEETNNPPNGTNNQQQPASEQQQSTTTGYANPKQLPTTPTPSQPKITTTSSTPPTTKRPKPNPSPLSS